MPTPLSEIELRFCAETGVNVDLAAGARIDNALIFRSDPASIAGDGFSAEEKIVDQIQSIEISTKERFGNYVIKLSNAFGLAKALNIPHVIHPGFEFMPDECEINGIQFSTQPSPQRRRLISPCYYHRTLQVLTHGPVVKAEAVRALSAEFSLKRPEWIDQPDEHLFIHIRSGDIFSAAWPHPYYAQPPLAFYQYVLALRRWGGATLVYENANNPVIEKLRAYLKEIEVPYIEQCGTLQEDLETLLKARHLVIARGTFAFPVIVMSRRVEQVYCFDDYHRDSYEKALWELDIEGVKFEKVVDRDHIYRDRVLDKWENSAEQHRLMIEYPVTSLGTEDEAR